MNRRTITLCLLLLAFALTLCAAAPALAWQNTGHGTSVQAKLLERADALARGQGGDWLDLPVALAAVAYPDTVYHDFAFHTYDRWGRMHGRAPVRIDGDYDKVIAALERGDVRTASREMGLLAHYYTDVCDPLHTDGSRAETARMHVRYELRVQLMLSWPGSKLNDALAAVHPRLLAGDDVDHLAVESSRAAHTDYRRLVRGFDRHGYSKVVAAATSRSLERAASGLAGILIQAGKHKRGGGPTPTPTPSPSATDTPTPTPSPSASETPTPTPSPTVTFTIVPTPADDVSVAAYGHDRSAVDAATSAAVSQGKALYFPAGIYDLGTTPWQVPDNLKVYGDGGLNKASWIRGYVLAGGHQSFTNVMIGSKTGRALGWKNIATRFTGTVFTRVRLRGGAPQTVQFAGSGSSVTKSGVKIDGLTFDHCWFEATYSTSTAARTFGVYTNRAMGQLFRNVTFSHCWFDSPNEQGTYSSWGGLEIWSSHDDLSSYPSDPANRGYDDLDFESCVFEPTYGWQLDCSGYQYVTDPDFGEGTVTVRGCVFKGCGHLGGVDPSGTGYHQGFTAEPGFNCVIENNYFGRCQSLAAAFTKNSNHNVVRNNVFDYVYNGLDIKPYSYAAIVRVSNPQAPAGFNDNSVTGNTLRLPIGEQTGLSAQGWVYNLYSNATVSGNSVIHSSAPLIDYSSGVPPQVAP